MAFYAVRDLKYRTASQSATFNPEQHIKKATRLKEDGPVLLPNINDLLFSGSINRSRLVGVEVYDGVITYCGRSNAGRINGRHCGCITTFFTFCTVIAGSET